MVNKHPVLSLAVLGTLSAALVWQVGGDDQRPAKSVPGLVLSSAQAQPVPIDDRIIPRPPGGLKVDTTPWAHPAEMHELRSLSMDEDWTPAIKRATKVIAYDQDVQIEVGNLLISRGDPVDGLAWLLLACMHCTQTDERLGYGCAAKGLCDPNLELIDIYRRDFGDQMVSEALTRLEELRAAIDAGLSLELFTELRK